MRSISLWISTRLLRALAPHQRDIHIDQGLLHGLVPDVPQHLVAGGRQQPLRKLAVERRMPGAGFDPGETFIDAALERRGILERVGRGVSRCELGGVFQQRRAGPGTARRSASRLSSLDAEALPGRALGQAVGDHRLQGLPDRAVGEAELRAQIRLADALTGRVEAGNDALAQRLGEPQRAREAMLARPDRPGGPRAGAAAGGLSSRSRRRERGAGLSVLMRVPPPVSTVRRTGPDSCARPAWPPAPSGRAPRGGRTRRPDIAGHSG